MIEEKKKCKKKKKMSVTKEGIIERLNRKAKRMIKPMSMDFKKSD